MAQFDLEDVRDLRLRFNQEAGDVLTNTIDEAIRESILNILNTNILERFFNRGFGSDLKYFLFELMNDLNAELLKNRLVSVIERNEPRVEVLFNRSIVIPNFDENRYDIFLTLKIIESGNILQFDTFISRAVR